MCETTINYVHDDNLLSYGSIRAETIQQKVSTDPNDWNVSSHSKQVE